MTEPRHAGLIVEVLGPLRVVGPNGGVVASDLSVTQRRIVGRLAIDAPHVVSIDRLIEFVWSGNPPTTARPALHNQISRLRTRLGPEVIETEEDGYRLAVATDFALVAEEVATAEQHLAEERADEAFALADGALRRWRGEALTEVLAEVDGQFVNDHRHRVSEIRIAAENVRLAAGVRLGRFAWALPEAERLVAATPYDERRWSLLMEALDRAGRRGDALGAYERARRILADDLGLDPGPVLRAAEGAVLGVDEDARRHPASEPVGRDALTAATLEVARSGGVALLVGEPGAGKSTVLAHVRRRLRRDALRVGWTQCTDPGRAAASLAELLEALGHRRGVTSEPIVGFVEAVGGIAASAGGVALLVDDIDRAGPTSLEALRAAAALPGVALVATAGHPDVDLTGLDVQPMEVPPLDREHVIELVAGRMEDDGDGGDDLVTWLMQMSGGNPLLIEYLLEESDQLDPDAGRTPDASTRLGPVPALRALVRRRAARLDEIARSALEIAAVCGPEVPRDVLDALAPGDGVDRLLASGLVEAVEHDRVCHVRFRHGAVQRAIYDDLPPGTRTEVHHRTAELLEAAGAPAAVIATHAVAAAELAPPTAIDRAMAAGREATAHGAHADAAEWYREATRVAADTGQAGSPAEVAALVCYGDALRLAGDPTHEQALFDAAEAAVALGEAELVADAAFAVLQLGATTESGARHEEAVRIVEIALREVTAPEQLARVSAAASLMYSMTGDPDLCRSLFDQAERTPVQAATRRQVLPFTYLALGHPADLERRERLTEELLTLAREADDPVALFEGLQLATSVAMQRADGVRLRAAVEEMGTLVRRVGDVGRRWALLFLQAAVAHLDGDLELAESRSAEALELMAPVSPSRALATYSAQLLAIRVAQGRVAELREPLSELVAEQPGVPAWHAAYALSLVDEDPANAADHAVAALDDVPHDFTWLAAHLVGGRAAAAVGDRTTIERYRERLLPWEGLACWQGNCSYGPVDSVLALLAAAVGEDAAAGRHRSIARQVVARLEAPVFAAELETTG